ncbi:hypothetical protein AAVH_23724 [Aphelenchoides avenae]|nr:hypothetical protein AAVH_23724 [Aphelenchus avenae]
MPTVDDGQSTTLTSTDPEHHATTDSGVKWPEGHTNNAKARTYSTPTSQDGSADITTKESNAEGVAPDAKYTTPDPNASGSELPTTTYEEYLKSIKLNLGLDFDLKDLSEEQKQNFNDLGKAYGLDQRMHEHVEFEVFRWCDRATLECNQLVDRRRRIILEEHSAALPMRRISSVAMENVARDLMRTQCECNPTQAVITGAGNHNDDFDVDILLDDAGVQKLIARLRNAYVEHLRLACTCSRLLRSWIEQVDPKCSVGWLHIESSHCRPTGVILTQQHRIAAFAAVKLGAASFVFGGDMDRYVDDQDFGALPFIHAQPVKASVKQIAFPWLSSAIPSSLIRYLFDCSSLQSCYVSSTELEAVNSWIGHFIEAFLNADVNVPIAPRLDICCESHSSDGFPAPCSRVHAVEQIPPSLDNWPSDVLPREQEDTETSECDVYKFTNKTMHKNLLVHRWTVSYQGYDDDDEEVRQFYVYYVMNIVSA